MDKKEWYRKENPKKPKEITIKLKLNVNHLKLVCYILIIVLLLTVITLQHYGVISTKDSVGSATKVLETKNESEEKNKTTGITIIKPDGEITQETSNSTTQGIGDEEDEEIEDDEPENELLPITGEIFLIINDIDYTIKSDDYARITSVTFTIKNQDKDLVKPKIIGYLTAYGSEDEKTIELNELKAGETFTMTNKILTFGYNNIDEDQVLNLELYNDKKRLLKTSKTFSTD